MKLKKLPKIQKDFFCEFLIDPYKYDYDSWPMKSGRSEILFPRKTYPDKFGYLHSMKTVPDGYIPNPEDYHLGPRNGKTNRCILGEYDSVYNIGGDDDGVLGGHYMICTGEEKDFEDDLIEIKIILLEAIEEEYYELAHNLYVVFKHLNDYLENLHYVRMFQDEIRYHEDLINQTNEYDDWDQIYEDLKNQTDQRS